MIKNKKEYDVTKEKLQGLMATLKEVKNSNDFDDKEIKELYIKQFVSIVNKLEKEIDEYEKLSGM